MGLYLFLIEAFEAFTVLYYYLYLEAFLILIDLSYMYMCSPLPRLCGHVNNALIPTPFPCG